MNALIGMECSGMIREALRAVGVDARSCDLKPAEDNSPWHFECDVRKLLKVGLKWDLVILHPDCTYLSSSGLHWNKRRPERAIKTMESLAFVSELVDMTAHIPMVAFENPMGAISRVLGSASQWVQPYEFGDDASKNTGLWLRGLPKLVKKASQRVPGRIVMTPSGKPVERWANQTDSGQNRLGPSEKRATDRARTYPGIARAIAEQWGRLHQSDLPEQPT